MDSQHYSPQQPYSPLGYPYDEDEDVKFPTQSPSPFQLFTSPFDNPPRSTPHQPQFLPPTSSPSNFHSEQQFGFSPHLSMSQSSPLWNGSLQSYPTSSMHLPEPRRGEDYAFNHSSSYVTTGDNDMFSNTEIPRGWEGYNPRLPESQRSHGLPVFNDMSYGTEELGSDNMHGQRHNSSVYQSLEIPQDFGSMNLRRHDEYVHGPSHYPSLESLQFNKASESRVQSCDVSDDGEGLTSREMTATEGEDVGIDEPYAKLIRRALMSKPDHSMVLQDIYQWFRDNTSKGDSENKGWMNSIRHNLSMNAAFKKTERKVSGDESKKSTEWVLEDFAIKDGVQSTTRYRKGAASKKFIRSGTPAPSRQRSGQKGGMSTRNTARLRRDDQYRRPRIETGASMRGFPGHVHRLGMDERQREPLNPPHADMFTPPPPGPAPAPYYGYHAPPPAAKMEQQYGLGFDGMCGLENVQGVHMDGGPVFASDVEMGYHHSYPGLSHYDNRS